MDIPKLCVRCGGKIMRDYHDAFCINCGYRKDYAYGNGRVKTLAQKEATIQELMRLSYHPPISATLRTIERMEAEDV